MTRNEIVPALTAMTLFAGTVLASQVLQHALRRIEETAKDREQSRRGGSNSQDDGSSMDGHDPHADNDRNVVETDLEDNDCYEEDEDSDDIVDLREMYIEKRRAARLSYGDLENFQMKRMLGYDIDNDDETQSGVVDGEPGKDSVQGDTDNPQQQQQHDDPFDFHPKNNNWGHFERHGEDDIKNGTVCLSEEEDDGSSSSSSNEGFLWTNASRKQQRKLDSIPKGHSEGTKGASPTLIPRSSSSQPANEKTRELSFEELPGPLSSLAGLASTAPPNNQKTNDGVNNTNHLNGPMSPASPFASLDPVPEAEAPSGYAGDEPDAHLQRQPMLPNSLPQIPRPTKRATRSQSNPERTIKRQFTIGQTGVSNGSTCDARNPAEESHGSVRALYNAQIMPNKVVMVRHGQSEGNINEALYSTTPDNAMRITRLGWEQARRAGEILKEQIIASGETVHFIVSPYVRTVETFHGIASAWCDPKEFDYIPDREKRIKAWYGRLLELGLTWHEDPRIREQDFGNYQIPEKIKAYKRERHQFGPFFYRFPHGESASDVFDRVSTFLDSLWRSFDLNKSRNYVLITHGISIRVLLARYFRYSIEQFNRLANPRNCEMVMLRHDGAGKLQLDGRCELELEKDGDSGETTVTGHEFRRRLRILPRQYIRTLHVRIGPDDDVPANCFPIPLNASTDTAS